MRHFSSHLPRAGAVALLLGAMTILPGTIPAAHAQTSVATYLFNNALSAEEGGVPALTATDPLGLNGFENASVFGQNRTVYRWDGNSTPSQQAGLTLDTTGLVSPNNYSVELVFAFTEDNGSWRRIVDTQNRQSDNGFYVEPGDRLQVYNVVTGSTLFTTNEFHHVVLTNFVSGGTQEVRAYLDGNLELTSNTDQLNLDNPNNPDNLLHLFLDNLVGGGQGEFADGRISLFRLYEGVLTPQQVQQQSQNPFGSPVAAAAPEPGSLALIALTGLPMVGALVRRRRSR